MEISKTQTLEEVHAASESVEKARSKSGLTAEEKLALEQISLRLSNIENALIGKIEDDVASKLASDSKDLMALSKQIEKSANDLKEISKSISKVTSVIESIIKAISLGATIL
jgi:septal ring factor EnvC (AmiA/AmiB activator)